MTFVPITYARCFWLPLIGKQLTELFILENVDSLVKGAELRLVGEL